MFLSKRGFVSLLGSVALWAVSILSPPLPALASMPSATELRLDPPPREVQGQLVRASGTVVLYQAVDAFRLSYQGEGALALAPFEETLSGPWTAGESLEFAVEAHAIGVGEGRVVITLEGLDESENTISHTRTYLYALVEEEGLWTSLWSWTDLRHHRLHSLFSRGEIQASELQKGLDDLITAPSVAGQRSLEEVAPTAHSRWLEQVYESTENQRKALENLPSGDLAPTEVEVFAAWTDRLGRTHAVTNAKVQVLELRAGSETLLLEGTIDAMRGSFRGTVQQDTVNTPDLVVRVLTESNVAVVRPPTDSRSYRMDSAPFNRSGCTGLCQVNLIADNILDSSKAFSVHQALILTAGYAKNLQGNFLDPIQIFFPGTRTSFQRGTPPQFLDRRISIATNDGLDWDLIHHEYGHYFAHQKGFLLDDGGDHSVLSNLATFKPDSAGPAYGKAKGILLAASEGWANYFAIQGQLISQAASLGIPLVGDSAYTDATTNLQQFGFDLETCFVTRTDSNGMLVGFGDSCLGEDNELSVAATLLDLVDSASDDGDRVQISDKRLFEIFKVARPVTIGDVWEAVASQLPNLRAISELGTVFGNAAISPVLTSPADGLSFLGGSPPPTFTWRANGGGTPNPLDDFNISFYNDDFTRVILFKSLGNVTSFTPSSSEFATILAENGPVRWVVEGRSLATPVTPSVMATPPAADLGFYWSGFRTLQAAKTAMNIDDTGSMGEEIFSVRQALASFIDRVESTLPADEAPPALALLTFKDSVRQRIVSSDLEAVRDAVNTLSASGGGDCPEFSAQSLQAVASEVGPGGTIVLATDASSAPGVDLGSLISQLRSRGVSVNTILSGDCEGIDSLSLMTAVDGIRISQEAQGDTMTSEGGLASTENFSAPFSGPVELQFLPAFDSHGDSPEVASPLLVGGGPSRGILEGAEDDVDVFRFELEGGRTYRLDFALENGNNLLFQLLNPETAIVQSRSVSGLTPRSFVVTSTETGAFFLRVSGSLFGSPTSYVVSLREDAFGRLTSAVEMFSTISQQTGGVFLVRDGINSGRRREYEAALFNVLLSSIEPAVLASNPDKLPRSSVLAVELSGRGTNWLESSSVAFTGDGIQVLSTEVRSATSLIALVEIDSAATASFRDVEVTTPLGDELEVSFGRDVLEITNAVSTPTLLSVEPNNLGRGQATTIMLRGLNTPWDASTTLNLGLGISVVALTVLSPTQIEVEVIVSEEAPVGFRTASVTTTGFGTQSKGRALFVNSGITAVAEILSVIPDQGSIGESLVVELTGLNTQFEDGVTTADFGPGIEVLEVEVLGPEQAKVSLQIGPGSEIGFRDLNLTTGGEVAVRLSGFFVAEGDQDEDEDGVPDEIDICTDTVVPEGVPTVSLGTNRWALVDNDRQFDTRTPGNRPPSEAFSLLQTGGCSCEQIIEQLGLGQGHRKFGCSTGVLRGWIDNVNP